MVGAVGGVAVLAGRWRRLVDGGAVIVVVVVAAAAVMMVEIDSGGR